MITVLNNVIVALGGPVAVNITSTLRDVVTTYVCFLLFDDISPTFSVVLGIGISFVGAIYYVYTKRQQMKGAKKMFEESELKKVK
jgi:hypothetical protein